MHKNPQAGVSKITNGYLVTTQAAQDVPPNTVYCMTLPEVEKALEAYYEPSAIEKVAVMPRAPRN